MISPSNSINTMKSHEDKVFERLFGNSGSQTAISPKGRLVHENPIQAAKSGVVGLHRTFSGSQFECGMYRNPVPSGPFVRCRHRVGSNIQVLRCYLVVHIRHFSNG